jgi:hypothetical protein
VHELGAGQEDERRELEEEGLGAGDFRAVAPAVMSFAQGRRR